MSREAMQQALEALESDPISHAGLVSRKQAITALRQALEEKQEPVAWTSSLDFDDDDQEIIPAKDKGKLGTSNCDIPLYTAPKREWVGLTDEEVSEVIDNVLEGGGWLDVARAIELALKEKNQ
jgi:alkylhydroperoxidase/carboxymuconolactone decarboxylase family protein YurZ